MKDFALGELGLKLEEYNRMTWGNYNRACLGYMIKDVSKWKHTRELIAIHTKKTARQIMPLPGDYFKANKLKPLRPDQLAAAKEIFKSLENGRSK